LRHTPSKKFRLKEKKTLNKCEETAFVAGIVEGEGTLAIIKSKYVHQMKQYISLSPRIVLGNNEVQLINFCQRILGGGIYKSTRDMKRKGHRGRFPVYYLTISGQRRVLEVLQKIYPYLISKKREAEILMEFCKSRLDNGGRGCPYTSREWEIYELLIKLHNSVGD